MNRAPSISRTRFVFIALTTRTDGLLNLLALPAWAASLRGQRPAAAPRVIGFASASWMRFAAPPPEAQANGSDKDQVGYEKPVGRGRGWLRRGRRRLWPIGFRGDRRLCRVVMDNITRIG